MFFGAAKTMEASAYTHTKRDGHGAPAVSIVTPAYNVAKHIAATAESVFAQTFQDFEWIIVNDGSPDTAELEAVLRPYLDRIVYIKQVNSGASIARNTGVKAANGELIAFLDGDDIWHEDYLERQIRFLNENRLDMVYADAELFGMADGLGETFMVQAPSNGDVTVDSLLDLQCNVITSGTVAKREIVVNAGNFEEARVQGEDFHLWVRIAHNGGRIGYQRDALLKYRVSNVSFSGDAVNRVVRAIDVFKRLDSELDLTQDQREIIKRRIESFEADLGVAKGKAFLLAGDFAKARASFDNANRFRWSTKLAAVSAGLMIAPRTVLKLYLRSNAPDIEFAPDTARGQAN